MYKNCDVSVSNVNFAVIVICNDDKRNKICGNLTTYLPVYGIQIK